MFTSIHTSLKIQTSRPRIFPSPLRTFTGSFRHSVDTENSLNSLTTLFIENDFDDGIVTNRIFFREIDRGKPLETDYVSGIEIVTNKTPIY
ncbi:hypothetical protein ACHAXS_003188 [Conticribra weissflogii]